MDNTNKKRREISQIILFSGIFLTSVPSFAEEHGLRKLNDSELADVQGQALMSLSYLAPTDSANKMQGQGIGFYKLGMEAELELNANIKKLQLGCGGVNGANGCDIDIDNLSLTGISDTRDGRVGSDAKLTNPFIEFAIKNPNSAATRQVLGLRLSADKVLGMLTLGDENSSKPNGINSLSGYMKTLATTGTATTTPRSMKINDTNMSIEGRIKLLGSLVSPGFTTNDYNLALQSANADLFIDSATISGTRMSSANLTGTANIGNINFGGNISANLKVFLLGALDLGINASGNISGLTANLNISENLGFIHKLPLNNPFSLSMQSQSIFWPGASVAANKGWWLAIEDGIDIGKITPSNSIDISNDILKQVVPKINTYLNNNPPSCTFGACLGLGLDIGNINLSGSSPLNFPIKDLQLATQSFAPNCYGNLKFC
ncbi:hypothetical protein [Acinetobacter stercoris]|uniref:Uncharacterized protein n=1 Tax=Acinetobacter stercoris TaxID=2126983 RepID=A0A2U3MY43_9GAMM|nr:MULTISPECIES: hypothetical protein [Acinetobacter]SPL70356.1 hypothetical protein KPC_1534 [Acinetobacter stercoris]